MLGVLFQAVGSRGQQRNAPQHAGSLLEALVNTSKLWWQPCELFPCANVGDRKMHP